MPRKYFRKTRTTNRRFRLDENARISGLQTFVGSRMNLSPEQRDLFQAIPDSYYFKSPVRLKSAICCSLVVHALITVQFDSEITTNEMTKYLNDEYPQILWDPVSVGKIMSAVADNASALFEYSDDFDWGPALPLARLHRAKGHLYYYAENDMHALAYFHALLHELAPYAERERLDPRDTAIKKGGWAGETITAINKAAFAVQEKLLATGVHTKDAIWDAYPDLWVFATTKIKGQKQRPHDPVYDRPIVSIVQ